jgi:hypothetical protein
MRLVGIRADAAFGDRAPNDAGGAIDEGMMHDAVRDVHHAMRAELEQAHFRRADAAANREPRAQPEGGGRAVRYRHLAESMFA